ncbi:MAG: Asp-tRNA(Asn)/Glu-tRNA(Gln) amidotransferase subunit GatC [Acidobacteria bacterium]|nr:Asp-tRNA(Asn)/Glu-tRNA(Gln) amidotransferase subunit GatC [Acidobacteriota bacterium]
MPDDRGDFDLARVAALARLALTPDEATLYRTQLRAILAFAAQLRDVPTDGVAPMTHVWSPALPERPDHARPSLPPDEALGNAPDTVAEPRLVRVPRVLG